MVSESGRIFKKLGKSYSDRTQQQQQQWYTAFQEDFKIFRLLPRPSATTTAYWRCKERVYFGGLETGLEKAV